MNFIIKKVSRLIHYLKKSDGSQLLEYCLVAAICFTVASLVYGAVTDSFSGDFANNLAAKVQELFSW